MVASGGRAIRRSMPRAGTAPTSSLMDIRMPGLDGIEATRRILGRASPDTRVLILTTFGLDEYIYEALRAGASGFLLKDAPPEELWPRPRWSPRGDALLAPAVTRAVIEEFARVSRQTQSDSRLDDLTAASSRSCELLARGCSNAEIADALVVSGDRRRRTSPGCSPNSASATECRP